MKMHQYEVKISVDGKPTGGSRLIEAPDPAMAKRIAIATESGKAGYAGKKITAGGWKKL